MTHRPSGRRRQELGNYHGRVNIVDPMIEVASASHSHSCAIADSLHGSEDVDGENSPPASSHGSFSDQEFMGQNAQWECVFLEVMINLAWLLLLLFVPHAQCMPVSMHSARMVWCQAKLNSFECSS